MLEGAGIAGGADTGTTEITSAPTSKGLSKFFGYKSAVTGVGKANKQLAMSTVGSIAKTLSPATQGSQIFLDFDRTLAFGADKIGGKINKKAPDYSAFGDPRQVAGGLGNAKLSGLGVRLKKIVSNLDSKSPGLGNELLKKMFVVSARPANTMPLIARWLRNQGLRIPSGNVSGVGGPGLDSGGVAIAKAEKMLSMSGPGSVFIDDDSKNVAVAREKGINSIQYGSSASKKAKQQAAQNEGLQFEKFISDQLPANLQTGIFGTDGEGIDFPFGLGSRIAQYWFNDSRLSNIPVDTKRTLTGPRSKIKDNILSYLKDQGYNAGGMVQKFANAGPVEEYYGQKEVEAARKAWSKFKFSVKKTFDSDKVYFENPMAKSIREGAEPEVYGTGIGKLGQGEPGVISSKKIRLAKQQVSMSTDPREAARRKAVRKQDELATMALKGLLGGLPEDKQKEVASLFGLSRGIGPSLMPSFGGGAGAAEELAAAKQGVSSLKKTGSLKVSKQFVDFFRSSLASYYLELKQASMLDPSDTDLKKQLKKTRRAGTDVRRSLRTDEPIGIQGRRTAASETLSLMLKEKFQGFAKGGSVQDRVPALLTPGEFVINKKASQRIGASRLHHLNRADKIQGFNKGGAVGYIQKLAKGGKTEKLAEAVGSFEAVSQQAAQALAQAMKTAIAQEFKSIRTNNPTMSANDALQKARTNVQPVTNFGAFRAAETGDQNAANMVADAQRKQANAIIKQIRAADSSVPISQAKAAAERRVADAWGGLYKRTKEQEQQASLLSRAMARVSGLYSKIKGSDLTPEQKEQKASRNAMIRNVGMTAAFAGPMLGDQVAQSIGGTKGAGLSAGVSAFSTYAAVGSQFGVIGTFIGILAGGVAALDAFNQGVTKAEIELNNLKIEKESQKAEKTLAKLSKDPKNAAATQDLIKSLDAMSTAEQQIQTGNADLRKPTNMGRLGSFLTGGYIDSTTPTEVKSNKEYQQELKRLQERNLNATEFAAEKRELVAKFTAQEVGQTNASKSKARSEVAMQALAAKGSQGLTMDEALGSFGSDAGKIQESIAAGSQKYAVELEKLVQERAAGRITDDTLNKRKKALIQTYYLEETETLRAVIADQARAKAANKVAKALNLAVTSIERTFGNMEAALNRGANALSEASASLDAMAADKSNLQNTFAGQNILENPRAYSRKERAGAVRQSSGFFGQDSGFVEKLTSTVGGDIKDSLTSIAARAQTTGASSKEATAQDIQRSVDQQLMAAFGNNDLTRQLSQQIKIQLDTQLQNKDTDEIDLDQLIASSTGLTSLIESEKKAFELLAQGTKQVSQALDIYTSKLVTATEMLNEVDNINAESISMRASNDFRLKEMLGQGQKVPLRERLEARSQEAAARAGLKPNQLNVQTLVARLSSLRQTRTNMEQQRSQFQEGKSFTDPATIQGIQRFNAGLINLDNQISKTKNAFKNLPKDIQGALDDVAGAMEDTLSKIESKREAGTGLAERMVTSTPTELANLGSTYDVLNNALNGQARTIQQSVSAQMAYQKVIQDGGTAVEAMTAAQSSYIDENKQVFSLFNELVAVGGIDKEQANTMRADLLETTARSQGLNMQNNPLFNQIIANLRRAPEEDPEIKRLKTLYEQLQKTQQEAAEATRQLVIDDATALVESAGNIVKRAIESARISFNEQQLSDIGLGLSRPGQIMGKADGGLIYASTGKLINFKPKGTDTVPAMLTPGEFVVNSRATKQNLPLLQSINKSGGGPVQYFAAGTAKPVSMSRNASTSFTNPAQARSFFDDIMRQHTVPAGGSVTPNPARSQPAQVAAAPKPAVLSTPSGSMYTVNPNTGGVNRPYMPGGIDYAALSPDDLLLEQKYLRQTLKLLKSPDGTFVGSNAVEAKKIIASIQQINAHLPPNMRPLTIGQTPAAASANTAAAPKPATQAAKPTQPAVATTPQPVTTAATPKPAAAAANTAAAPKSAIQAAKDFIAQRGPVVDYDAIQPDAGGTMRTTGVKPKPAGGFFSGIMSRIGDMMGSGATTPRGPTRSSILPTSASQSARFSASAGDLVEGAYRVGQAAISDVRSGANYVAQSVAQGARGARAYVASSATSPGVRGGLAAAGAGMAADYALGAMGASEGVRNTTSAAIDFGTTAYQGSQIGAGAAASARIFTELGIQSAYEVGSAIYDTPAYIDRKRKEEGDQQQARNDYGFVGGVGSNIAGNIFGTDASIYKPTTWIPGRGIPSAIGRASVAVGDTVRARQSAADQKNTVDARQAEMNTRYEMKMPDGRTRALGVAGQQWVRRKIQLEADYKEKKITEDEYNKFNKNLEDDRNAVDVTKGIFSNTSTRRMSANNEDLDYAVTSETAFQQQEKDAAARKAEEQRMAEAQRQAQQFMQSVTNAVQTGSEAVSGVQNLWNYGQSMWTTMQSNAEAKRKAENIKRTYKDASVAMAKPSMPEYVDKFKQLADQRRELEQKYQDAGSLVDPELREQEQNQIRQEIEEINSTVVKQQRAGQSAPFEERQQAWNEHNKAQATAEAKAQREVVLAEKREINDELRRKLGAYKTLDKISRVPAPIDPERVPEWRAKSLEKIRDKFNLSGDSAKDIELMTAYGMSPELAKGLFRPLTEDQNKAVYELLSQQTQKGQYKYSDSDLQLLKMSRQQIMDKVNKRELKGSMLARKEILETAREKEFGKSLKEMGRINSLAQRGMSANPRAQGRFRETLLKKLVKQGYIDPRESDAANAQRLSSLNLNANTVSFVYPAQVGGMLAGRVDNAQQKSTGGVVYASNGKLINFKPRGSDTVPAMLTPGEFVINARATQQNLPLLQAINKADGGVIGGSQGTMTSARIREQQTSVIDQKQTLSQLQNVAKETSKINNTTDNINSQQLPNLSNSANEFQKENFGLLGGLSNTSSAIYKNTKFTAEALSPLNFNKGGPVYASQGTLVPYQPRGSDTVPAMLTPGEFVVNARSTSQNLPLLKAINNSKGGVVYAQNGIEVPTPFKTPRLKALNDRRIQGERIKEEKQKAAMLDRLRKQLNTQLSPTDNRAMFEQQQRLRASGYLEGKEQRKDAVITNEEHKHIITGLDMIDENKRFQHSQIPRNNKLDTEAEKTRRRNTPQLPPPLPHLTPQSKQYGGIVYAEDGGYLGAAFEYLKEAALQTESFAYGAAKSALPTIAGAGAATATSLSGPAAIGVGIGAGVLTAKAQENYLNTFAPDLNQYMNDRMNARPWASLGGSAIGGGLTRAGGNATKIPELLKGSIGQRAASGGVGGGLSLGMSALDGNVDSNDLMQAGRDAMVSSAIPGNLPRSTGSASLKPPLAPMRKKTTPLFHATNSGLEDAVLRSFQTEGGRSNIAEGYGQGKGLYTYNSEQAALKHAESIRKGTLQTGADRRGTPMVVRFDETLDPKKFDLDYEYNAGYVVDWVHKHFDKLQDLLKDQKIPMLMDRRIDPGAPGRKQQNGIRTSVATSQGGLDGLKQQATGLPPRRWIYGSQTDYPTRDGEILSKIMQAVGKRDPGLLEKFRADFFEQMPAQTAIKYIGEENLSPTNIKVLHKKHGGIVYASAGTLVPYQPQGTDTVPAMLTPGEFVVNSRATQQHLPMLQAINKAKGGRVSYYDDGGSIPVAAAIGPQESANIRAQQEALTIQKQTADKISSIYTNTDNTARTIQNIDSGKLPQIASQTKNYQDINSDKINNLNGLSNENLTKTKNIDNYLDKNNVGSKLDAIMGYSQTAAGMSTLTNALLMEEQLRAGNLGGLAINERRGVADAGDAAKQRLGEMFNMMFSRGGMVYASNGMLIPYKPRGSDTVPAMLTPGEFVVNRSATKANLPLLQSINGGAKGFANGGQVNYMAGGGILGQLFAPMLGTFKGLTSAVQLTIQALQTYQKQLAGTQPNSVSNTSGSKLNLDGLSEFTTKFDQFISALNDINIPPMVNLQVAPVTVNITGAEALVKALEGPLGGMLQNQITVALNNLSANTEGAIRV